MGWHDATIYAVQFGKDISFDIDYIFEWVQADKDDFFSFVITPVTLVFPAPQRVAFSLDFRFGQEIEIEDIHRRTTDAGLTEWYVETQQGDITITADAFRQIVRRHPTYQTEPRIMPEERGDPSFSQVPETDFTVPAEVAALKAADVALRQKTVALRWQLRQLEILREQRSAGALELKQYLVAKREVERLIAALRASLRTTD